MVVASSTGRKPWARTTNAMTVWTIVTTSTAAAKSSCPLPGGLSATAVTRPQTTIAPDSAITT